jgi:hypothetical protein
MATTQAQLTHQPCEAVHVSVRGRACQRAGIGDDSLAAVGLPAGYAARYSYQLSGGEKQRSDRASLRGGARFVVCDEPVSSLDVSVRASILNLLGDLSSASSAWRTCSLPMIWRSCGRSPIASRSCTADGCASRGRSTRSSRPRTTPTPGRFFRRYRSRIPRNGNASGWA